MMLQNINKIYKLYKTILKVWIKIQFYHFLADGHKHISKSYGGANWV